LYLSAFGKRWLGEERSWSATVFTPSLISIGIYGNTPMWLHLTAAQSSTTGKWVRPKGGARTHCSMHGWYREQYPEVKMSGLSPVDHYLTKGAQAGYAPHPLFDTAWYVETYPEIRASGTNPLVDYVTVGATLGRAPNPNFDTALYLLQFPDIAATRIVPLVHYLRRGGLPPSRPGRRRFRSFGAKVSATCCCSLHFSAPCVRIIPMTKSLSRQFNPELLKITLT